MQVPLGSAPADAEQHAATLMRYLVRRELGRGDVLWRLDSPADEMYIVEGGLLRVGIGWGRALDSAVLCCAALGCPAMAVGGLLRQRPSSNHALSSTALLRGTSSRGSSSSGGRRRCGSALACRWTSTNLWHLGWVCAGGAAQPAAAAAAWD
jgi:hypothetical protein